MGIDAKKKELRDFISTKKMKKPLREIFKVTAEDGASMDVEIRQPKGGDMDRIKEESHFNPVTRSLRDSTFNAYACMLCVYVPGTNDRIWGEEDLQMLLDHPPGEGFPAEIGAKVLGMIGAAADKGKTSAPTATEGSSSASVAS